MRKINPNACFAIGISYFFNAAKRYEKALGKKLSSAN